MMGVVMTVKRRPTLKSWKMVRFLFARTITFGGVPMGKSRAREENRVAGARRAMGALPSFGAWTMFLK